MVINTSALVAILLSEPEADEFMRRAIEASIRLIGMPTYLETCMVMIGRSGPTAKDLVDCLVRALGAEMVPMDEGQARRAVDAFIRYGKGRGSPAGLNFGDCCSYALAAESGLLLLFKGGDFSRTDILIA